MFQNIRIEKVKTRCYSQFLILLLWIPIAAHALLGQKFSKRSDIQYLEMGRGSSKLSAEQIKELTEITYCKYTGK